jgi:hypothetical protein
VLCCVVLRCVALCGVVMCCVVWCGVVWCGVLLCGVVWFGVVLCCAVLCCVVVCCVVRCCVVLCCVELHVIYLPCAMHINRQTGRHNELNNCHLQYFSKAINPEQEKCTKCLGRKFGKFLKETYNNFYTNT